MYAIVSIAGQQFKVAKKTSNSLYTVYREMKALVLNLTMCY